jgi:hypothetical protein
MSSKTATWLIALGALIVLCGLCLLPAAFGEHGDRNMLGMGSSLFGLGAITVALGIYLKAGALQSARSAGSEAASASKPIRGGCDACHVEPPVVHCKVHRQHLCGSCLERHYDFRTCVYAPSPRRATSLKSMAARAR